MATNEKRLAGKWTKADSPACAARYPATLELDANGLYRGASHPPGEFTLWDLGTWKVIDAEHMQVSTANDAVITYAFAVSGDRLIFTDGDGCNFGYRRSG